MAPTPKNINESKSKVSKTYNFWRFQAKRTSDSKSAHSFTCCGMFRNCFWYNFDVWTFLWPFLIEILPFVGMPSSGMPFGGMSVGGMSFGGMPFGGMSVGQLNATILACLSVACLSFSLLNATILAATGSGYAAWPLINNVVSEWKWKPERATKPK